MVSSFAISRIVLRHKQICIVKNLPSNVVHTKASNDAFETLKSRMIFARVLLISNNIVHEAQFVVATNASKAGIVRVLLQEDTCGSLRPCAYWARKLKIC